MPRNNDDITWKLLDYLYQQICYKLIDVDLSRQKNTCIPQELNFTGKLENDCTTMFFLAEKPQKLFWTCL